MTLGKSSELPLIDVHDGAVGSTYSVRKSQALVQTAGGLVGLIYADVHRVSPSLASFMQRCIDQGPPDAGPAKVGDYVQLCEMALQTIAPDRHTAPEDCNAIGTVASEQNEDFAPSKKTSEAICQRRRRRSWLIEFTIEVVQEPANRVDILESSDANGMLRLFAHVRRL